MALYRDTPKCPYCGKDIATGKYEDQSQLPSFMQKIGDTFSGWSYKEHSCKEMKKFLKNSKSKIDWALILETLKNKKR